MEISLLPDLPLSFCGVSSHCPCCRCSRCPHQARSLTLILLHLSALDQEVLPSASHQCALGSALPLSVVLSPQGHSSVPSLFCPVRSCDTHFCRTRQQAHSDQPGPAPRKALSHVRPRIMASGVGVGKASQEGQSKGSCGLQALKSRLLRLYSGCIILQGGSMGI